MADEKNFAVLIDSDNISGKYIKYILDEVSNHGSITYKRVYGDWTGKTSASWKNVLLENSLSPIQQYSYTKGKNATDSAMIIDAMDIQYTGNVEGFCIVSSDSDFTRLAARLREAGKVVIGMGEKKTPKPFCAACNIFKYIDILIDEEEKESSKSSSVKDTETMTNSRTIENAIINIIIENGDEEIGIDMGELGSRLVKRYPDFDTRNYGYTKLSKFLANYHSLDIRQLRNSIYVKIKDTEMNASIEDIILDIVKVHGYKGINMATLSQKILNLYPHFNVREYGYSKFEQFLRGFHSLEIIEDKHNATVKKVILSENI